MHQYPALPPSHPANQRPSEVRKLLQCASGATVFHSDHGQPFASLPLGEQGHQVVPIHSPLFRDWLAACFYRQYEEPPSDRLLRLAVRAFEARALVHSGAPEPVSRRTASRLAEDGLSSVVLHLGNEEGEVVEITREGWRVLATQDVSFRHGRGNLPLPRPSKVGSPPAVWKRFRSLLNIPDDRDWLRCLAWLLAALRPAGPFPVLLLDGPPTAGKSTAARMLRALVDPSTAPLLPLPSSERLLLASAWRAWVLAFDHVSRVPSAVSHALCRLSTGVGFEFKELFDQHEPLRHNLQRPLLLTLARNNGSPWPPPADLAARSLLVEMPSIAPELRRTQAGLEQEFEALRPSILGALCSAMSAALGRIETVRVPTLPAFADAAAWAVAAAPALGVSGRDMIAALAGPTFSDPVPRALCSFMRRRSQWTGPATALLARLRPRRASGWPATPKGLSERLGKAASALASEGLEIRFARNHRGRLIRVTHRSAKCDNTASAPSRNQ